jgi:phosphopentomutase
VSDETDTSLGWWSISGVALLEALRRVAEGENPDIVYAELYANSDHSHIEGE